MKNTSCTRIKILLAAFVLIAETAFLPAQQTRPTPGRPSVPTTTRPRPGITATPTPGNRPSVPGRTGAGAPATGSRQQTVTQPKGGQMPSIPYDDNPNGLNFQDASVDLVLMEYALRTGRVIRKSPGVPAVNITLRSPIEVELTDEQYLAAIETILNFNSIALIKTHDKFLDVVASADLPKFGVLTYPDPETGEIAKLIEDGRLVSQIIELKHIDISEAQSAIQSLVRNGAHIQLYERPNSLIVTDTADNVNKIVDLFKYIDKPIIAREEPNIIQIKYAKAADIKTRLTEIITEIQEEEKNRRSGSSTVAQERSSGAPGTNRRPLPQGTVVPGGRDRDRATTPAAAGSTSSEALIADAQRGILRGKVSIIADERTNTLIIITPPENMVFFERVIKVLDIPTNPDFLVEVFRLEHAVAADVASLLNDLIGNAKPSDTDAKPRVQGSDSPDSGRSQTLDAAANRAAEVAARRSSNVLSETAKTKLGQLDSENIKILSDERTNAILIMSSFADMFTIREIIKNMDIMLSQVKIETILVDFTFENSSETGIDWVQRAMVSGRSRDGTGPAFATALSGGGGSLTPVNPLNLTTTESFSTAGGVSLFATMFDFNIDLILRAVATDSRARLINSPTITTMDNKDGEFTSTRRIYYTEGSTTYYNSDRETQNIKTEDIGIKLKVTPRINKKGYIALEIVQEIEDITGWQELGGNRLPVVSKRTMSSSIAVQSGETIVLGGLASNSSSETKTKIPFLGDIPLLGWFFRSTTLTDTRNELVMFLTPRVMDTPAEIADDARNRKASLDTDGVWPSSTSISPLADPISAKEAKKILERGEHTIAPPQYPLTGHLTPINEKYGLTTGGETATNDRYKMPFVHYTELPYQRSEEDATPQEAEIVPESETEAREDETAKPAAPAYEIVVTAPDAFLFNGESMNATALEAALKAFAQHDKNLALTVFADKTVPYGQITNAIDIAKRANIGNIDFRVLDETPAAETVEPETAPLSEATLPSEAALPPAPVAESPDTLLDAILAE